MINVYNIVIIKWSAEDENMKLLSSLKTKIIVMLIAISIIPVAITGLISYSSSKQVLKNKLEATSQQTIQEITRGLDNYMHTMTSLVDIMSKDSNIISIDNRENFSFAKGFIFNVKMADEKIRNVVVGSEKGFFYTEPYAALPEGFDHKARDWYIDAVADKNSFIISDPYIDTGSGEIVITMSKAVLSGGTLKGVVAIDIDLAALAKDFSNVKVGDTGYVYITDRSGLMIAHPQSNLIGTNEATQLSAWSSIQSKDTGFEDYAYKGVDYFSSYDTSKTTGWKIIATMERQELENDTNTIKNLVFAVIGITAVIAVILAFLFSMPIAKNIKLLVAALGNLSKGDLTSTVNIRSKDEFNLLSKHFNTMVHDLSVLMTDIREASNTVFDTSTSLSSMAEETKTSLNEVTRAIEEVANGATEQAKNSTEGASSLGELSDKLDSIEDSTGLMAELSSDTTKLTEKGLESVQGLLEKSEHTMHSTAQVSELVLETSRSIKQIDEISNTIDAITEQTSLLSLNASIEAARAGESGRGFAVVADEIRKLADQSKASTVQIKAIVEDINRKTDLSVEAMKQTNENVQEQEVLVQETPGAFREISNAVLGLSNKVSEIQVSIKEIASDKNNIVDQIENVSAIAEETASATEEVTASSEEITSTMEEVSNHTTELKKLAGQLQSKLSTFKTK